MAEKRVNQMKEKWLAFYNSKYFLPVCAIAFVAIETFIFIKIMDAFNLWFALIALFALIIVVKVVTALLTMILSIFK